MLDIPSPEKLLKAGRMAAGMGWSIIPVGLDKRPPWQLLPRGEDGKPTWKPFQSRQATDEELQAWAAAPGVSGWAVVTGQCSGVVVIDFDGASGMETLRRLGLPPFVRTGGGGSHVYVQHPGWYVPTLNHKAKQSLGERFPGVDVRGDGGYAVFYGASERGAYTWLRKPDPLPLDAVPPALRAELSLLRPPTAEPAPMPREPRREPRNGDGRVPADVLLRRARELIGSQGRNNAGFWLAVQLRDNGYSASEADAVLGAYARSVPGTDLHGQSSAYTEREALASVRQAYRMPAREPWGERERRAPRPGIATAEPREEDTGVDLVPFRLTDVGNAERLLALYGRDIRYVPQWRAWIVWNGRYWERDLDGAIYRMALRTVRKMAAQFELKEEVSEEIRKAWRKHVKQSESHRKLCLMIDSASKLDGVAVKVDELDRHPHLLPAENGTLDLRTGELGPHRREHLMTRIVPLTYDPNATCPAWDRFMEEVFQGRRELIAWVWRSMGYCLTGEVGERCIFILWGAGNNGKSTLLETFADLMGDYAQCVDPGVLMEQRAGGSSGPELAQLPGKRFVYTGETARGRRLNEDRIKRLAGADSIQACAKYEMPFTYRPQFKLWMATNHKPEIRDTDRAIWKRIRLVPFLQIFSAEASDLASGALPLRDHVRAELLAEASGAFTRLVAAAGEFYRDGLGIAEDVRDATAEYRSASDVIGAFIEERCEVAPEKETRSSVLWEAFKAWAERAGENAGTRKAFGQALSERGFVRFTRGNRNPGHWRGQQLAPDNDSDGSEPEDYEPGAVL